MLRKLYSLYIQVLKSLFAVRFMYGSFVLRKLFINVTYKKEVFEYPFEVNEVGWGEFEAGIQIIFKDEDEAPVDVIHLIKLYHPVEDTVR